MNKPETELVTVAIKNENLYNYFTDLIEHCCIVYDEYSDVRRQAG